MRTKPLQACRRGRHAVMGQPFTPTSTIVMYTYGGDSNLDGKIDADDYGSIDFNILVPGSSGYGNGDFNYDGVINADDYGSIDFNILAQGAPFPAGGAAASSAGLAGVTAVPEPASSAIFAIAASALLRRRRRAQRSGATSVSLPRSLSVSLSPGPLPFPSTGAAPSAGVNAASEMLRLHKGSCA